MMGALLPALVEVVFPSTEPTSKGNDKKGYLHRPQEIAYQEQDADDLVCFLVAKQLSWLSKQESFRALQ
jgi:hypothetical protein